MDLESGIGETAKFPPRLHYSELSSSLEMKEDIANLKKVHKSLSQVVLELIIIQSAFQVLRLQIFTNKPGFQNNCFKNKKDACTTSHAV